MSRRRAIASLLVLWMLTFGCARGAVTEDGDDTAAEAADNSIDRPTGNPENPNPTGGLDGGSSATVASNLPTSPDEVAGGGTSTPSDDPTQTSARTARSVYEDEESGRRRITSSAATKWFRPQRVLTFHEADAATGQLEWFAISRGGGTTSPATDGPSRLEALLVPSGSSTDTDGEAKLLGAGALQLFQAVNDESIVLGQQFGEKVTVRGNPASMFEAGTLHTSNKVCNVSWSEVGTSGHFVGFLLRGRIDLCTDHRLVEIANRLVSLAP